MLGGTLSGTFPIVGRPLAGLGTIDTPLLMGSAISTAVWGGFGYYLHQHKWPKLGIFFMLSAGLGLAINVAKASTP